MRPRDNPYRVQRVHELSFRAVAASHQEILEKWDALGSRGALVGNHGHGKSTLLAELLPRLASRGWSIRHGMLRSGDRNLPSDLKDRLLHELGPTDLVVLDGAEVLSRWSWFRFRRAAATAGGVLITSHRAGLLPTVYRCETSVELLRDLMSELHPGDSCAQPSADELYQRHHGDLRLAFRELYDYHAHAPECRANCLVAAVADF